MNLVNLKHFFAMGGYAYYVWISYGAAFLVLLINAIYPYKKLRFFITRGRHESKT